jgi:hypothetical protein
MRSVGALPGELPLLLTVPFHEPDVDVTAIVTIKTNHGDHHGHRAHLTVAR